MEREAAVLPPVMVPVDQREPQVGADWARIHRHTDRLANRIHYVRQSGGHNVSAVIAVESHLGKVVVGSGQIAKQFAQCLRLTTDGNLVYQIFLEQQHFCSRQAIGICGKLVLVVFGIGLQPTSSVGMKLKGDVGNVGFFQQLVKLFLVDWNVVIGPNKAQIRVEPCLIGLFEQRERRVAYRDALDPDEARRADVKDEFDELEIDVDSKCFCDGVFCKIL